MKLSERLNQKSIPINSFPRYGNSNVPYQVINGRIVSYADSKANFVDKGYTLNDMIYAVINIVLDKVRVPQWGVYKVVDEEALKQYKGMMSRKDLYGNDYRRAMSLHRKAVEPITDMKLEALLEMPNEREGWNDFITNGCGYKMITGDKFIWANLLKAGANTGLPQELHNLASQNISIVASNTFPVRELGYTLRQWQINFPKEQVLHDAYWNPTGSMNGDELYGLSPLKASLLRIQKNNSSVVADASAFDNMGIAGVLYVDDERFDADGGFAQAQAVKNVLANELTGATNNGKIGTSGYKMGWQAIGISPKDMMTLESGKADMRYFCNIFGVPSQLLNDPENKSYNNQKEGEAALTSRCAMPQLISTRETLNRKLHRDWGYKGKNVIVDFDPTVFTELNQSAKEIMEYMSLLTSVSPNEERTAVGLDAISEAWADEQFLKVGGREPRSVYESNIVDDELNNGADTEDSDGAVSEEE